MNFVSPPSFAVLAGLALSAPAAVGAIAPYTADVYTLALYHFDEAAGVADPGNPIANYGSTGASLNLTNTGGPDGRDNNGSIGGYGAPAFTGFGSAFSPLLSGDGGYHSGTNGVATGGGAHTAAAVAQSNLQGADGAFTYEALVVFSNSTSEQTIISHDGATRHFMLRLLSGQISFYNGSGNVNVSLPTVGDHVFAANEWFHVALTYNGNAGATGNMSFYWTRLGSGATEANLLATGTLGADLTSVTNTLGVGTITRSPYRFEPARVDEVRISSIARSADSFVFIPEPASLALLGLGGLALMRRVRASR